MHTNPVTTRAYVCMEKQGGGVCAVMPHGGVVQGFNTNMLHCQIPILSPEALIIDTTSRIYLFKNSTVIRFILCCNETQI
jgi:hypothetical protein